MEISKKLETRMDALNETIQGFLVCWDFTLLFMPVLFLNAMQLHSSNKHILKD